MKWLRQHVNLLQLKYTYNHYNILSSLKRLLYDSGTSSITVQIMFVSLLIIDTVIQHSDDITLIKQSNTSSITHTMNI